MGQGPVMQRNQDIEPVQVEFMFNKPGANEPRLDKDPDVWEPPSPKFMRQKSTNALVGQKRLKFNKPEQISKMKPGPSQTPTNK